MKNIYFEKQKLVDKSETTYRFIGKLSDLKLGDLIFNGLDPYESIFEFRDIKFTSTFNFSNNFFLGRKFLFYKCEFLRKCYSGLSNTDVTISSCTFGNNILDIFSSENSKICVYKSAHDVIYVKDLKKCNICIVSNTNSVVYFNDLQDSYVDIKFDTAEKVEFPSITLNVQKCYISFLGIYYLKINEINFSETNIDSLKISECKGNELLLINEEVLDSNRIGTIQVESNLFNKIYIRGSLAENKYFISRLIISHSQDIVIQNIYLNEVVLDGARNKDINFWNCDIEHLEFNEFAATSGVDFGKTNLVGLSKLTINGSSLNNIWFGPSFLHQVNELEFSNSSLIGIQLYNFKYLETKTIKGSKSSVDDKIDFTRELGFILVEQGNLQYARMYKALELELRMKQFNNSFTIVDKIILGLNFWSNVHGTMPQKALFWILVLIAIQFGIINLDLAFQTRLPYEAGFDFLGQNYSYFIKPLTFLTEVEADYKLFGSENLKVRFSPYTKGFDFLFKIFYAYLLYQFIAAFRKFNK